MAKTAAKKPSKSTKREFARKTAVPAGRDRAGGGPVAAPRGKLERVKVPAPAAAPRPDSEGKYVYCIVRSEEPLSFGPLGLGQEPADVHTVKLYRARWSKM